MGKRFKAKGFAACFSGVCWGPLRVLRLARFAALFPDFTVADDTALLLQHLVRSGELENLTRERVWLEVKKACGYAGCDRFFAVLAEHNAWIALDSGCGGLDDYEWSLHAAMWQQLANPLERFAALGMVLRAVDAKSLMRFCVCRGSMRVYCAW